MIPEGVPSQLRDQSVILVEIVAIVREDQVGRYLAFELLERLFHEGALVRQEAIAELLDNDP